jgi:hypothetical protein
VCSSSSAKSLASAQQQLQQQHSLPFQPTLPLTSINELLLTGNGISSSGGGGAASSLFPAASSSSKYYVSPGSIKLKKPNLVSAASNTDESMIYGSSGSLGKHSRSSVNAAVSSAAQKETSFSSVIGVGSISDKESKATNNNANKSFKIKVC